MLHLMYTNFSLSYCMSWTIQEISQKWQCLPHCVYSVADHKLECMSPGEKITVKTEEGTEPGRLIYFSKFSNQIRLSLVRKNK